MKTVTFNLDPLKQQTNTVSSWNIKLAHAHPTMQYIPLVYKNSTVQLARVGPAQACPNYISHKEIIRWLIQDVWNSDGKKMHKLCFAAAVDLPRKCNYALCKLLETTFA